MLDDTDFYTEIEWALNANSKDDDYYDDELYQDDPEDNYEEDMTYYRVCNTGKKGCPLSAGGVPPPDLSGMTQAKAKETMRQWRVVRKAYTDKKERERQKRASLGSNESTDIEYSGVLDERLRLMTDVEMSPILIGHTFPTKEVLLIRMAEEANFCGCQIAIQRSDNFKVHAHGMGGSSFSIQATYSTISGWKVTSCLTREVANADDNNIAQLRMVMQIKLVLIMMRLLMKTMTVMRRGMLTPPKNVFETVCRSRHVG